MSRWGGRWGNRWGGRWGAVASVPEDAQVAHGGAMPEENAERRRALKIMRDDEDILSIIAAFLGNR